MSSMTPPYRLRDDDAEVERLIREIKETADLLRADAVDRGDAKILLQSLRELRDAFRLFARFRDQPKVTMFGSARIQPGTPRYQQAVDFGRAIAAQGYMVITGAGPGIMEAGHVGASVERSIGLNIVLPFEQDANNVIADDEKLLNLKYFFTRKLMFLKEAHALALFPGGFGTLDEGFEILTMLQTGKSAMMPIVMLDVPGGDYWERWREYIDSCLAREGMIAPEDFNLFRITHSVDEAVEEIVGFYRVYHSQRFVKNHLALRLKRPLSPTLLERINDEFKDILASGGFKLRDAHPHESNEPDVAHLTRLVFHFDRKSHGRLRELINVINRDGAVEGGAHAAG